MKHCKNCQYAKVLDEPFIECRFPLPQWLLRFAHNPLTGDGPMVRTMNQYDGDQCEAWKSGLIAED